MCLATCLLLLAPSLAEQQHNGSVSTEALAGDVECISDGSCGLSAVQLHSEKTAAASNARGDLVKQLLALVNGTTAETAGLLAAATDKEGATRCEIMTA